MTSGACTAEITGPKAPQKARTRYKERSGMGLRQESQHPSGIHTNITRRGGQLRLSGVRAGGGARGYIFPKQLRPSLFVSQIHCHSKRKASEST